MRIETAQLAENPVVATAAGHTVVVTDVKLVYPSAAKRKKTPRTLTYTQLRELAQKYPPPQEWFDETNALSE
jgi:hypothetical protein